MTEPKDADNWAKPIKKIHVEDVAEGAFKGNVEGRKPTGPLQGFGRFWPKTYQVSIPGPSPESVIQLETALWRLLVSVQQVLRPCRRVAPGEIAVIVGGRGPTKVTTGVRVIYADDTSWSYMTPEGHPWAAIIIFSAHEEEVGTAARIHLLVRANAPLYEASFGLYTGRLEDKIWTHTLTQLAAHFDSSEPVELQAALLDNKRPWDKVVNIWKNSEIRTLQRQDRR